MINLYVVLMIQVFQYGNYFIHLINLIIHIANQLFNAEIC